MQKNILKGGEYKYIGIGVHKESRNDIFVGVICYSAIQRDLVMV